MPSRRLCAEPPWLFPKTGLLGVGGGAGRRMRKNGCRAKAPWEDPSFSRLGILWRLFIKGLWFAEATSLSGPKFSTPPPPPPGASSTPAARGKCSPAPIHHQVRCSPPLRPHCAQGPQDLHKDKRHLENRGAPRPELESQFPSLHFASPLCPPKAPSQRPPSPAPAPACAAGGAARKPKPGL